jgi:hypothetical protein
MQISSENPGMIIVVLALFVVAGAGWWIGTLLWHLQGKHPNYRRALVGLQINVVLILFAWLLRPSGLFWAAVAPWYPPIALYAFSTDHLAGTIGFFALPLMIGIGVSVAVAALCLLVKPLRLFTIGLAGLAGLAAATILALTQTPAKIEAQARGLNAQCLAISPLWQSRKFAGAVPQLQMHAVARITGEWHGFSYALGSFYPLPPRVKTAEIALIADCKPLES